MAYLASVGTFFGDVSSSLFVFQVISSTSQRRVGGGVGNCFLLCFLVVGVFFLEKIKN